MTFRAAQAVVLLLPEADGANLEPGHLIQRPSEPVETAPDMLPPNAPGWGPGDQVVIG
jgi:hypothetical protein